MSLHPRRQTPQRRAPRPRTQTRHAICSAVSLFFFLNAIPICSSNYIFPANLVSAVRERRMTEKLSSINVSHPLPETVESIHQWQASSPAFLPSAVRLYSQACSESTKHMYNSSSHATPPFPTHHIYSPYLFSCTYFYMVYVCFVVCLFVKCFFKKHIFHKLIFL